MTVDLDRLTQGTGRDLHTLQIKLTYVGSRLKAIPSVAFTTFYHLLRMDWFVPLRHHGLNYASDDGDVWNFTISPEAMARVVRTLAEIDTLRNAAETPSPELSLMLALRQSRLGDTGGEVRLDVEQGANVSRALLSTFDDEDGIARNVMALHMNALRS